MKVGVSVRFWSRYRCYRVADAIIEGLDHMAHVYGGFD
jgi:hypothetical protein